MKRSKGFKLYNPTLRNIIETRIVTFYDDIEFGGRNKVKYFVFEEELVYFPELVHIVVPIVIQDIVFPKEQNQLPQYVSLR